MFRFEADRSEFAVAGRGERIVILALCALCLTGGVITFVAGADASARQRWLAVGVIVIACVPFMPDRRWRMATALVATCLVLAGFILA